MKKILHITASYKPAYIYGGPIYSVAALCENLVKAGYDVDVFTTTANGEKELEIELEKDVEGVRVYYFKRITRDHSHFSPSLMRHLWRTAKMYDAVHIHSWWNLVSMLSVIICILRKVTPVLSPRGMLSDYTLGSSKFKKLFLQLFGKKLSKKIKFHATSDAESNEIKSLMRTAHCNVVHNLVHLDETHFSKDGETSRHFRLLFLGRIDPKKGLELLFDALSFVNFDYSLTIAGSGEENYVESLKNKATSLKISERIEWVGTVTGQDRFKLYAANDLFILTSYNENFANVVVEALSEGTAVLLSDKVGLSTYVRKNALGWTTKLNAAAVASALNTIAHSQKVLSGIRSNAPAKIRTDFTPSNLLHQYIELYHHEH